MQIQNNFTPPLTASVFGLLALLLVLSAACAASDNSAAEADNSAYLFMPLPLQSRSSATASGLVRKPLWLHITDTGSLKQAWHTPALTPAAAALKLVEQQRKARLAKRMADRAFYFGYDTNKDALK